MFSGQKNKNIELKEFPKKQKETRATTTEPKSFLGTDSFLQGVLDTTNDDIQNARELSYIGNKSDSTSESELISESDSISSYDSQSTLSAESEVTFSSSENLQNDNDYLTSFTNLLNDLTVQLFEDESITNEMRSKLVYLISQVIEEITLSVLDQKTFDFLSGVNSIKFESHSALGRIQELTKGCDVYEIKSLNTLKKEVESYCYQKRIDDLMNNYQIKLAALTIDLEKLNLTNLMNLNLMIFTNPEKKTFLHNNNVVEEKKVVVNRNDDTKTESYSKVNKQEVKFATSKTNLFAEIVNDIYDNAWQKITSDAGIIAGAKAKRKKLEEVITDGIATHFQSSRLQDTWSNRINTRKNPWDDNCLGYYDEQIKKKSVALYNALVEYRKLGEIKPYRESCDHEAFLASCELDRGNAVINHISDSVRKRGNL